LLNEKITVNTAATFIILPIDNCNSDYKILLHSPEMSLTWNWQTIMTHTTSNALGNEITRY